MGSQRMDEPSVGISEGIHRVRVTRQGQVHDLIEGLNDVQIKILRLFGEQVCCLYQIAPA
jgi:hypothetical protein